MVITELDPKAVGTLQQVLQACVGARQGSVEVVLSNPALQLLQNALGEGPLVLLISALLPLRCSRYRNGPDVHCCMVVTAAGAAYARCCTLSLHALPTQTHLSTHHALCCPA